MKKQVEIFLPTEYGNFYSSIYPDSEGKEHILMVHEKTNEEKPVLVRIHSECMTGDLFHSLRCDCGYQIRESMRMISEEGGILVYLRQEGRGIGLTQKYFAYKFQDMGYDTIEANEKLGYKADLRNFAMVADMLKDRGIREIRLLTNNLKKVKEMNDNGIEVVERVPLFTEANAYNEKYLFVKKEKMGHQL
ncbi:GTP cyclohydrolase II [Terrihalobacillus insolitus]|uniref:GTP cyclohydrolase II n=1 Tax=Terrihalobacillus insolitus TaxID=2950438 RepID=UPI002340514C|nr:GTP cyclohydrolase II [Terrihalobacillus insolitus]MDC3412960.1 GTP cyclohydrolase II [Terrihalobacillus insolitus]